MDTETRLIFGLADYFKSQDSGKCYDFAERLYKKWDAQHKLAPIKKLAKIMKRRMWNNMLNTLNILKYASDAPSFEEKENMGKNRKILMENNEAQFRQSNSTRVSPMSRSNFKQRLEGRNSSETVFEKLHAISRNMKEKSKLYEQMRNEKGLEFCTFHPQLSTEKSPYQVKQEADAFNRLSKSNRKEKYEYYQAQKAARELQYCTFSPNLPNHKGHGRSLSQGDTIHNRLFKQSEVIERTRKDKETAYKDRELDGCTFAPKTNWRNRSSSLSARDIVKSPYERLYRDSERKLRENEKNHVQHEEAIASAYTFRPTLVSKSQTGGESLIEDNEPRYKKLYSKHLQKKQMLEQKRKELEEEARKMHETVEKMRGGAVSRTSLIHKSKSAKTLHDSFGNNNNKMLSTYERLHSKHKESLMKKEFMAQKLLSVFL